MQLASFLRWVGLSAALVALALVVMLVAGAPGKGDAPEPPTDKKAAEEEAAKEVSSSDTSEETTKVSGEVAATTDPEGDTEYTLRTSEGRVFELSAGPPWFYEEGYPLEPFVGETVTVTGEVETNQNKVTICHKGHVTITVDEHAWPAHDRHGDTMGACSAQEAREEASEEKETKPELEVFSITSGDGQTTEIRSPGKPPWAGGPKAVGEKHPGFGKDEE